MEFADDRVLKILDKLPSECPNIDYKEIPYKKDKDHDFIRDIISMLNSEDGIGKDKFIIMGVRDNDKSYCGIELGMWRDDNQWQNLVKKIIPKPTIQSGTVHYQDKLFAFIYIRADNTDWVYEVAETVIGNRNPPLRGKNGVFKGQAFTRVGSMNCVLTDEGRKKLLRRKTLILERTQPSAIVTPPARQELIHFVAMVGTWDETYPGDKEIIEELANMDYQNFQGEFRRIYLGNQNSFTFKEEIWECKYHKNLLLNSSESIFNNVIDTFFNEAERIFMDVDPKYSLPKNQRYAARIMPHDARRKYSKNILRGFARTIAILGNNQEVFNNCSKNYISNKIYDFERKIFHITNWEIYASIAGELQYLGEACPDVFLKEIERLASEKDETFVAFLSEEEESIITTQYGYQLGWTLSNIAKLEVYFSRAMMDLLLLAEIREDFLKPLIDIVLPWFPQTHASAAIRTNIFKELSKENEALTWKALMKLMPGVTTVSSPTIETEYLTVENITNEVSERDYVNASIGYVNIACTLINQNVDRMCELVDVFDDVPEENQGIIINAIKDGAAGLAEADKGKLWNKIQDFMLRHRKFADAKWALDEEELRPIEELSGWLIPDSESLQSVRLFRSDQFILLEGSEEYKTKEKIIREKQKKVIEKIYKSEGLNGIKSFTKGIGQKAIAGICLLPLINDNEIKQIIMDSHNIATDDFLKGLVTSIPFNRLIKIVEECDDMVKARIYSDFPITDQCIEKVDQLDMKAAREFWSITAAWNIDAESLSLRETAVKKLNKYDRADKGIEILFGCLHKGEKDISVELVVDTLELNAKNQKSKTNTLDEYYARYLIKWLQGKPISRDAMVQIEWKYLEYLDEDEGFPPTFIWLELSSNPVFFMDILEIIYGKKSESWWSKEDKSIVARHCFKLLTGWKRAPGLNEDGNIDSIILTNWVDNVKKIASGCELMRKAMEYFGKAIFHAPADRNGFFINKDVAKYLQNDKEGYVRSGYYLEAINSRGFHSLDPTGQEEFDIEERYRGKARIADEEGLFRFAETLRGIANHFHEEGITNRDYNYGME